jgi:L-rhamnose mutarotase
MSIETTPYHVTLVGFRGAITAEGIPTVGKRLMDNLWREVKARGLKTKGINYWVYLPESMMFTGVELAEGSAEIGAMEELKVSLDRYYRHVHTGPYSDLAQVWPELFAKLQQQGESPSCPSLEIYGHWNPDPALCQTTILHGLAQPGSPNCPAA